MDMHPLGGLIPTSNVIALPMLAGKVAAQAMEAAYNEFGGFVGAFLDKEGMPSWARRIAAYNRDEFKHDTPGTKKRFSDVTLADDGAGKAMPNWRHALDLWKANGEKGQMPYDCYQDYGSCVDASAAEHMTTMLGYRAVHTEFGEVYVDAAAWYWYADRGYCSDGWDGWGCAKVALRRGVAFRKAYSIGSNSIDFSDDDKNEQIVARTWCRTGIPSWMYEHTQQNHGFEDGAITEFDGDIKGVRALLAQGGAIHTGGTNTSGGSKPFSIGRVGPHMQSVCGGDDSDEYRKFCKDVIGVTARDNDFPVVFHQTWGSGWSGECADKYWPAWWGPKPQGAWVWWASDLLKYFRGDMMAWLPRFKGVTNPSPTPTPGPGPAPTPNDQLYFQGVVDARQGDKSLGQFILVPRPQV